MLRLSNKISNFLSRWAPRSQIAGITTRHFEREFPKQHQLSLIGAQPIGVPLSPFNKIIINDQINNNKIIENPRDSLLNEIRDIIRGEKIYTPPQENADNEIQAARLIVIRRRKMKKHKLKKLRKKMKFEWAKVRQRREMRKEKAFQAELISQIKEAEKFSAEQYVMSKLQKANETPIPRFWKGRRLPQFIIKQKLGLE